MKILEILNMSSLPIEQFYHIVADIFQSRSFAKKKRSYELYFYPSKEQSILHFCQFYTHYNLQTKQVFQPNNLLITWEAFFRFIRLFAETRTVLTVYALV
jgi:inhibitor of KinA sporulation pathway (predicted exonuclease)